METYTETEFDIIHETEVDFVTRPVSTPVHLVQYDNSLPLIKVNLFNNGRKFVIPDVATVWLRFKNNRINADPGTVRFEITLCNTAKNAIYFRPTSEMTNLFQKTIGCIELKVNDTVANSSPLAFIIDKNPKEEN